MAYKLTKAKAAEFHAHCPSGATRHSMGDYRHMLTDGKFDVSDANRHWVEVYGRFGYTDDDDDDDDDEQELEAEIAEYLGSTACYF